MTKQKIITQHLMAANYHLFSVTQELHQAEEVARHFLPDKDDPLCLAGMTATLRLVSRLLTFEIEEWEDAASEITHKEEDNGT